MKRENLLYVIIAGLIIALVTMIKCEGDDQVDVKVTTRDVPIKIPEIKGGFQEPNSKEELPPKDPDTIYINGKPVYLQSPLNKKLKDEIATLKDSLSIIEVLLEANRRREYLNQYEDKYLQVNAKATTYGTLENLELYYTIKERDTVVKETTIEKTITKTDNFGILGGLAYKQKIDETPRPNVEVMAGMRIKKTSIIATANTNREIGAGVIIEF